MPISPSLWTSHFIFADRLSPETGVKAASCCAVFDPPGSDYAGSQRERQKERKREGGREREISYREVSWSGEITPS